MKDLVIDKIPNIVASFCQPIQKILFVVSSGYWKKVYQKYREEYDIDSDFKFRGTNIIILSEKTNHKFSSGKNSYIGENSSINLEGGNVTIGNNCHIGQRFKVHTSGSNTDDIIQNKDIWRTKYYGDIIIEDNVWIGNDVTVLGNVKIGHNSVVGTCSVITKNVKSNTVVVGNNKVVKKCCF